MNKNLGLDILKETCLLIDLNMSGLPARIRRRFDSYTLNNESQSRSPAVPVILAIDDESQQIETLRIILKPGFRVIAAGSVDEGLEVFRRERPDTVIMDVRMPGKDGLRGLAEIRELDPLTSVILLTAYSDLEIARHAIRLGANEFMTKPYDVFELHRSVQLGVTQSWHRRRHVARLHGIPWPSPSPVSKPDKSLAQWAAIAPPPTFFESCNYVTALTPDGSRIQGNILRLNEDQVISSVQGTQSPLAAACELHDFHVVLGNRTAYRGKATINQVMETHLAKIVDFSLGSNWFTTVDTDEDVESRCNEQIPNVQHARRALRSIDYSFKIVVSDMLTLLRDLHEHLEGLEMELRKARENDRDELEYRVLQRTREEMLPSLEEVFEEFEAVCRWIPSEAFELHLAYAQKHLHPYLICAPFIQRVYEKPFGFPGDYVMLNQLLQNPYQGSSLFAKIINAWIVNSRAGDAYRYRIEHLTKHLLTTLASADSSPVRLLSLGCGAAEELQRVLRDGQFAKCGVHVTLVDFNEPTLIYCKEQLDRLTRAHPNWRVTYEQLTVQQFLTEASCGGLGRHPFDMIYCTGLFDYLQDRTCNRVIKAFFELLREDGRIIVSNFSHANPIQAFMNYLLEWHLLHRDREELRRLVPDAIAHDATLTHDASPEAVENYLHIVKA